MFTLSSRLRSLSRSILVKRPRFFWVASAVWLTVSFGSVSPAFAFLPNPIAHATTSLNVSVGVNLPSAFQSIEDYTGPVLDSRWNKSGYSCIDVVGDSWATAPPHSAWGPGLYGVQYVGALQLAEAGEPSGTAWRVSVGGNAFKVVNHGSSVVTIPVETSVDYLLRTFLNPSPRPAFAKAEARVDIKITDLGFGLVLREETLLNETIIGDDERGGIALSPLEFDLAPGAAASVVFDTKMTVFAAVVPEPNTLILLVIGSLAIVAVCARPVVG